MAFSLQGGSWALSLKFPNSVNLDDVGVEQSSTDVTISLRGELQHRVRLPWTSALGAAAVDLKVR